MEEQFIIFIYRYPSNGSKPSNFPHRHLGAGRQGLVRSSSLSKRHLCGATAHETRELDPSRVLPLGELLGGDGVGVLAGVEALEEGGGLDGAAAHVEGPADEGAVLVGVQDDVGGGGEGDAVLGGLFVLRVRIRCAAFTLRGLGVWWRIIRTARSDWRSLRPLACERGME